MKQPLPSPGLDTASPSGSAGSTTMNAGSTTMNAGSTTMETGSTSTVRVLGVDGCPGGWIGAWLVDDAVSVVVATTIAEVVARVEGCVVVGIDMPMGLPDSGDQRAAEALARRRLPPGRKSSVFPTPMRVACEAPTWAEANALNKQACGRGLSHQGFGLTRKILEVDAWVRSVPGVTVAEVHPEVSFAAIDPSCVVASKKTAGGRAARVAALESTGMSLPAVVRGPGYAVDDLLDACVVAWSARRVAVGEAVSLPDPPEVFSDGIPAAIRV
jgi:predicted RNase H-like nuclease